MVKSSITSMRRTAASLLLLLALCLSVVTAAIGGDDALVMSQEELHDASLPLPVGGILSSGQPDAKVLDRIAESGYVAVIDLRGIEEDRGFDEASEVERRGLKYFSLPVASRDDVSFENATKLDQLLASVDGPVLVHCASGNRVGALFALSANEKGASIEESLGAGRRAGMTSLEPVVTERITELLDDE